MSAKKLGFGMMRLPLTDKNDASSIDIEQTKRMVDAFIAGGFTYFDTAWMYCSHKSEDAVKTASPLRQSSMRGISKPRRTATVSSTNSFARQARDISITTLSTT